MSSKKLEVKSFEDLKAWKVARNISKEIFELVKKFPSSEKFSLTSQMIRSSRSISDNIAEGYGRFHFQENIQYCRQARGSAYELMNQIITANDCSYIDSLELDYHKKQISKCIQLTNGYIRYLNKAKSTSSSANEDQILYSTNGEVADPPNNE